MSPLEEKSIAAFNQMWNPWENPNSESVQKSISTWVENGKGFGSGLSEIWKNRNDFTKYCEEIIQHNPNGFSVKTKWLETDHLDNNIVAIWGEMIITIKLPIKNVIIDPIRFTGVYKNIRGEMKLIQWHASEPDISSDDEVWPGTGEPKYYEQASILFTDFVGFTGIVSKIQPEKLIKELNEIFAKFDTITERYGLSKIKTIGDSYMAAGGLSNQKDYAIAAIKTADGMLDYLDLRNKESEIQWNMRIGVHCGPVIGGVIGSHKLSFDLWGETVNLASRIESSGEAGRINVSAQAFELIKNDYNCQYRGKIKAKGKGDIDMYFVIN